MRSLSGWRGPEELRPLVWFRLADDALQISNLKFQISNFKSSRGGTWMQRWRVPLGFACAVVFLYFAAPSTWTLIAGAAIAVPGLVLRAWASGHLRKNETLATTGPYAYTRNPLYLGSSLIGLGFTIAAGQVLLIIIFIVMILGIYLPVMRVESATLGTLFGKKYDRYAKEVPLLFPRFSPYRRAGEVGFDRNLYLRYREYRATIGVVIVWMLLAAKMIFWK
jgi:protein-S-isoprenylcysteine O-methyltransferase Ste14